MLNFIHKTWTLSFFLIMKNISKCYKQKICTPKGIAFFSTNVIPSSKVSHLTVIMKSWHIWCLYCVNKIASSLFTDKEKSVSNLQKLYKIVKYDNVEQYNILKEKRLQKARLEGKISEESDEEQFKEVFKRSKLENIDTNVQWYDWILLKVMSILDEIKDIWNRTVVSKYYNYKTGLECIVVTLFIIEAISRFWS